LAVLEPLLYLLSSARDGDAGDDGTYSFLFNPFSGMQALGPSVFTTVVQVLLVFFCSSPVMFPAQREVD